MKSDESTLESYILTLVVLLILADCQLNVINVAVPSN